jgi:hypothetical protein
VYYTGGIRQSMSLPMGTWERGNARVTMPQGEQTKPA